MHAPGAGAGPTKTRVTVVPNKVGTLLINSNKGILNFSLFVSLYSQLVYPDKFPSPFLSLRKHNKYLLAQNLSNNSASRSSASRSVRAFVRRRVARQAPRKENCDTDRYKKEKQTI